jgi:hypothetical protein
LKEKEQMNDMPPEHSGDISLFELGEASLLQHYYWDKKMGKKIHGERGLALCEGAQETGITILTGIRNEDGEFVFIYDRMRPREEFIFHPNKKHKFINVAFHMSRVGGAAILPDMSAIMTGKTGGKKRNIKVAGFDSSNEGESDFDLEIANVRTWSAAMSEISENLTWIEQQFTRYGIIDDPMMPISDIPMYVAGRGSIQSSVELMMEIEEDMKDWE